MVKPRPEELGSTSCAPRCVMQMWKQLEVHNGVLWRLPVSPDSPTRSPQVVPCSLREAILADLREGTTGGHLGIDKTLARLKERF